MNKEVEKNMFDVQLRWRDLDNQGHVYHATFFTLLDEARTDFFRTLGFKNPESYVLVRIEMEYIQELTLEEPNVSVGFEIEKIGKSSIHLIEEMYSNNQVKARTKTVIVLWDKNARGPRTMSSNERLSLEGYKTPEGENGQ